MRTKRLDEITARVEAATAEAKLYNRLDVICTSTPAIDSLEGCAWRDVPYLLAIARAAERAQAAGFVAHPCRGAWEPLQNGETWKKRAECCEFCAAFSALRAALESNEDVR